MALSLVFWQDSCVCEFRTSLNRVGNEGATSSPSIWATFQLANYSPFRLKSQKLWGTFKPNPIRFSFSSSSCSFGLNTYHGWGVSRWFIWSCQVSFHLICMCSTFLNTCVDKDSSKLVLDKERDSERPLRPLGCQGAAVDRHRSDSRKDDLKVWKGRDQGLAVRPLLFTTFFDPWLI